MWHRIDSSRFELHNLSIKRKLKDTKLKLAGIGTPQILISNILLKGSYTPYVPEGSIRRSKTQDFSELMSNVENDRLFDEENQPVLELAGSIPINHASDEVLRKVEGKLQEVTKELINRFDLRFTKTRLQETTITAFGRIHVEENTNSIETMIKLLQDVITTKSIRVI